MEQFDRRGLIGILGASAAGLVAVSSSASAKSRDKDEKGTEEGELKPITAYELPDLPYPADALEPHLDAETLAIHHGKHHASYVKGLNDALEKMAVAQKSGNFDSIQAISRAIAFHGAGHELHTLYFANLGPHSEPPKGVLAEALTLQFGSLETMKAHLAAATNKVAGSGWGMLAYEPLGSRLLVLQIEKHENQIIPGAVPLLVIDAWEHAYYLKYQNKRADYVSAVMNVIDWARVEERFERALA